MTMPALIANYKKQIYVTSLKKFYTEFSQVILKAKADTGCSDMECLGFWGDVNDEAWINRMKDFFGKYYNVVEFCKGKNSCEESSYSVLGVYQEQLFRAEHFSLVTADGFVIRIQPSTMASEWTSVTVDINGSKKPNALGRDIFLFRIHNKNATFHPYYGLYYSNAIGAAHVYWKNNEDLCGWDNNPLPVNLKGYGCAARVIESGWKMNY